MGCYTVLVICSLLRAVWKHRIVYNFVLWSRVDSHNISISFNPEIS